MLQCDKKNGKAQQNTFIDGISVKISENYKPPRKVILPVSCQNSCLGESYYVDYNFRLEKYILSKVEEWKKARRLDVEEREERLNDASKVRDEHFNYLSIGSTKNEGTEQSHQHVTNHTNLTDSVLTPTSAKQNSPSHKPVLSKLNLSDFESDNSSPFDNMELKTINDMEVLATILSVNAIEQTKSNCNSSIFNNQNKNNSFQSSSSSGSSNNNKYKNNNINNDNDNLSSLNQTINSNIISNNNKSKLTHGSKNHLESNSKTIEWVHVGLHGCNSIGYNNLDGCYSVVPWQQNDFSKFGLYPISDHKQVSNYGLNDFSNQFASAVPLDCAATTMIKSLESDLSGRNNNSKIKERVREKNDVKFVANIVHDLEKELIEHRERNEENLTRSKLAHLKDTILSSGLKDQGEIPETSIQIGAEPRSKLADPTSVLSPSSQKLVVYISEMGFPRARAARACQLFQNNDKKIIEFLLQVQNLEEKKYPGDLAEKALIINNFEFANSVKYLEAMMVLLDLGFEEEKAEEALIAANIDRDKALDMLIE